MALTQDRNTPHRDGELIVAPVAAGAVCYAGGMACVNASGFAVPASTASTLTYLGRFDEYVDNSAGGNGALSVMVRRKKAFQWKNSAGDAVTQASLGKHCYIVDDETVSASNGGNTRSMAGVVIGLDADGVWVE